MKYYGMLVLAMILIVPFLIFGVTKHLIIELRKNDKLNFGDYSLDTSYLLDIAACQAIYNIKGYTLSATSYERDDFIMMLLANLLFWDMNHCYSCWKKEYKKDINSDFKI